MTIPSNSAYEQSVLCALIFEPELRYQIHDLDDSDFYFTEHIDIFRSIKMLIERDQPVNNVTLLNLLSQNKQDKACILVAKLSNQCLSPGYLSEIIGQLKKLSKFRRAQSLIDSRRDIFTKPIDQAQREFEKLTDDLKRLVWDYRSDAFDSTEDYADRGYDNPTRTILQVAQERQEQKAKGSVIFSGHPTHYIDIDKHFDGFQPGHLTIIGARPGIGKTTFALNLALNMAFFNGLKVGIFSLEMMGIEITEKLHCIRGNVPHRKIKKGEISGQEFQSYNVAYRELKNTPIRIDARSNLNISKIGYKIKSWIELKGVQIVFIDYLQLISPSDSGKNKYEQVTEISQTLKVLAKECNIPIISLAQVNRESTQHTKSERPKASQLRDSGALEQDADEIFLLHSEKELPQTLEVIIEKNRFGSTGNVKLHFMKDTGLISNFTNEPTMKNDEKYFTRFTPVDDSDSP